MKNVEKKRAMCWGMCSLFAGLAIASITLRARAQDAMTIALSAPDLKSRAIALREAEFTDAAPPAPLMSSQSQEPLSPEEQLETLHQTNPKLALIIGP